MIRLTANATLFPYTTLFRSHRGLPPAPAPPPRPPRPGPPAREPFSTGGKVFAEAKFDRTARAAFDDTRQEQPALEGRDRKSTRLNSSHVEISYAVFCLKKKN